MADRGEPGNAHNAAGEKIGTSPSPSGHRRAELSLCSFRGSHCARWKMKGDRTAAWTARRQGTAADRRRPSKDSLDRFGEFLAAMAALPAMAKIQHTELTV